MQGSVCVNERCGYRQKGEHRNCPRCGWLMLDGPLPQPGSIAPPPRVLDVKAIAASAGAAAVLFVGAIGLVAGSFATSDPTAHASTTTVAHAAPAATTAPAHEAAPPVAPAATSTPAPIATPAAVAAAAPASVAKKATATKAPAKKTTVAKKKAPAKKTVKKTVARR